MQVGNLIRINSMATRVYGFRSNIGLIVDTVPNGAGYPPDYEIIIDGETHRVGYSIKDSAEVISESR